MSVKGETIVSIQDVWWKYSESKDWILKGVSLDVRRGQVIAIVGPTGAGKSTLCLTLNGLVPHSFVGEIKGNVTVGGWSTMSHSVGQMATKVAMIYQDPESQFVGMTVTDEVVFGPENLGLSTDEIRQRLTWVLKVVNMENYAEKLPFDLSGGQKQRIALASGLAMLPDVLVMDEPTTELDPLGRREVYSVIEELKENHNMTIVWVEQDSEKIVKYADRVILLDSGRILLDLPTREFFEKVDYLREHQTFPPQVTEAAHLLRQRKPGMFDTLPLTVEEFCDRLKPERVAK